MVNYKLYQVKRDLTRDYAFRSLDVLESTGVEVDLKNYELVYEGEVEADMTTVLEDLYRIFNIEHPEDFRGRSLSVSDIVQIEDDYFFCDAIGWKNIKEEINV